MTITNLLNKGSKTVSGTMKRNGYIVSSEYEDGDNYIVEFAKTHAGVTIKNVSVTFSPSWRVIDVKEW